MKKILSLSAALLCVNCLFAQLPAHLTNLQNGHIQTLSGLLQQNNNPERDAMRTTSGPLTQRVIAQSKRDNTLNVLDDSVNLRYNLFRGSTYDYNTMIYAYNYPYSASPMFNFAGVFTKPQVLADTMMHWEVDPNTLVYGYYETCYGSYDTHYNLTGYLHLYADSSIYPNMRYTNKFNSVNNIDSGAWFNWIGGVSDSAFRQFFTYNTSNKLTKDSVYEYHAGAWKLVSKSLYTYDVSSNLIQIDFYANDSDTTFLMPLVEKIQYINTYDGSNRLLTVLTNMYEGGSLSAYVKDTFAYTGTHAYHTAWREYQYDPINMYWAPMFNMTKAINGLGLPDTVNINSFDSLLNTWVPMSMDIISYNSMNNPDTVQDYEYNFTAFPSTPSFTTVYYYQNYNNSLNVQSAPFANEYYTVYPNPAHNYLTISRSGNNSATPVSIGIMNVNGQMVLRENTLLLNEASLTTSGLSQGIYWVTIQDASGGLLHRQSIVIE